MDGIDIPASLALKTEVSNDAQRSKIRKCQMCVFSCQIMATMEGVRHAGW